MTDQRPQREPINDPFKGIVIQVSDQFALATTPLEGTEVVHQGQMMLRYGVEFLGKPQFSIVPGLIALDYGELLAGEEAWDFLLQRSNLYPRADVIGYRNDGVDDMIVVKKLDIDAPIAVQVYADADATVPIARVRAFVGAGFDTLPERAQSYLKHYNSPKEWQAVIDAG